MATPADIPLSILVVDADRRAARVLADEVSRDPRVTRVVLSHSVDEASAELRSGDYNTVFVDPISIDLDLVSKFIFSVRQALPEIVFVLFVDQAQVEAGRDQFFAGERRRFGHYYALDKQTPIAAMADEVAAVLTLCSRDLSWRLSAESLRKVREAVANGGSEQAPSLSGELSSELDRAISLVASGGDSGARKVVFLSHRFAETEYVNGLTELLQNEGFVVSIGAPVNTYVSRAILQRIADADYFICLMTRGKEKVDGNFTTSPWLLEEKGAALALRKPIVLLVEHGVDDFGGLQGDWQRIHFAAKGFLIAALQTVQQLKSYEGI